jgi:hypothetical protein
MKVRLEYSAVLFLKLVTKLYQQYVIILGRNNLGNILCKR